jgi:di/tricarboxylate transporter
VSFHFVYTIIVLVLLNAALITELVETDMAIFSSLILLVIGGVINLHEAFAGFANEGMLTVAAMCIVAAGLEKTGILNRISDVLLGRKGSIAIKLFRFTIVIAAVSAFFNNTPIVAMMIPAVIHWTRKNQQPASKYLIPLSYATILGGTCTLIGTSTNLVVHGMMLQNGLPGLGFFEISKVGVPVAIIGVAGMAFFFHKLLPSRNEPFVQINEHTREFVIAMKVEQNYPHLDHTVEEAGLRHLKGLFLFQIERETETKSPIGPDDRINLGDRLFFTGLPETIIDLQKTPGLSLLRDAHFDLKHYDSDAIGSFEVVVSADSPLAGQTVRESNFRSTYDAVILAIHRSGERIRQKIGDIVLRPGDTLLILASQTFLSHWYHSRHFYLVSRSVNPPSKPRWYAYFSLAVLIVMIVVMAFELVPVLVAGVIASLVLIFARCIPPHEARQSLDLKVIITIAGAFGISKALENSGFAFFVANKLLEVMGSWGIMGLIVGTYVLTSIYTELITNNAAAALMVPIVLSMAKLVGAPPLPFMIAVVMGASNSFATPISYQTNMMVYGPGGYKFIDYLKIGIPMKILTTLAAVCLISLLYL